MGLLIIKSTLNDVFYNKLGAFKPRPSKPTQFRFFYERGDFPIALGHDTKGNKIQWKVGRNQRVG